ncbi:hypothetical protein ACROYT_G014987 [Oculina patagonica]
MCLCKLRLGKVNRELGLTQSFEETSDNSQMYFPGDTINDDIINHFKTITDWLFLLPCQPRAGSTGEAKNITSRYGSMASLDTLKPNDRMRACLVVTGGTLGTGDFAVQEAQRYGCHFRVKVPYDHYLARAKHKALINPEFYSQEKLRYFRHVVVLQSSLLNVANAFLERANQVLKRTYPCVLEASNNVLRRYYWLVKDVAAVYAFGELTSDKKQVIGGTGFAVQMALDCDKSVYVFCLKDQQWFVFSTYTMAEEGNAYQKDMRFVAAKKPPTLANSSTFVGHRLDRLNVIYNEVQALFKRTFISDQELESVLTTIRTSL